MRSDTRQNGGKLPGAEADDLARRFRAGDTAAFDELVRMFQRPIFNLAFRMMNNREDAGDAAQEIFVKLYRSIGKFRSESSFGTWLYAVAANTCRTRLREIQRRRALVVQRAPFPAQGEAETGRDGPEPADPAPSPGRVVERRELAEHARQIVAELPPEYAEAVVMRDIQDMSYDEIAGVLGCSIGTVKSRLFRGRMMAKEKLMRLIGDR